MYESQTASHLVFCSAPGLWQSKAGWPPFVRTSSVYGSWNVNIRMLQSKVNEKF